MLEIQDPTETRALAAARILVVDDDALARFILADQLDALGCGRVDTACDGVHALDCALTRRYHLVITDLRMPQMGGQALLAAMRERGLRMPVIAGTAWREPADGGSIAAEPPCGFAAVLRKPYSMGQLSGLLREHIGGAPLRRSGGLGSGAARRSLQEAFAAGWAEDERVLRAATAVRDAHALLERLHRLHGALAVVGARRARVACAQLQRRVQGGGIEANAEQIEHFLQACARIGRTSSDA
ncbi:hypothetical protein C0Z18_28755 [Trinickia dabaoshanensis]|uniref:Response regulator n=1 Tax=Trinickia dabaoshanensis TaxID=564714 RepID=A0A2N7VD53_9BURK|nr:response regulator [Trinickia dabaoshanensis]PMS15024.1 hypothetical protein C0Z18_28755 [Trinickia dabaoshanensis]